MWQDLRAIPLRAQVVKIRLIRLNITIVHLHMLCTNSPVARVSKKSYEVS